MLPFNFLRTTFSRFFSFISIKTGVKTFVLVHKDNDERIKQMFSKAPDAYNRAGLYTRARSQMQITKRSSSFLCKLQYPVNMHTCTNRQGRWNFPCLVEFVPTSRWHFLRSTVPSPCSDISDVSSLSHTSLYLSRSQSLYPGPWLTEHTHYLTDVVLLQATLHCPEFSIPRLWLSTTNCLCLWKMCVRRR